MKWRIKFLFLSLALASASCMSSEDDVTPVASKDLITSAKDFSAERVTMSGYISSLPEGVGVFVLFLDRESYLERDTSYSNIVYLWSFKRACLQGVDLDELRGLSVVVSGRYKRPKREISTIDPVDYIFVSEENDADSEKARLYAGKLICDARQSDY